MTRKQMEAERDQLAEAFLQRVRDVAVLTSLSMATASIGVTDTFSEGFNAALELMEENRVKPLRKIAARLNKALTAEINVVKYAGYNPHISEKIQSAASKMLAKVEEWE